MDNNIEIDNMEIFCHGDAYNLYFKDSTLHSTELSFLEDFPFSKDATLILHSCNSGNEPDGIAQGFADKEDIIVEA